MALLRQNNLTFAAFWRWFFFVVQRFSIKNIGFFLPSVIESPTFADGLEEAAAADMWPVPHIAKNLHAEWLVIGWASVRIVLCVVSLLLFRSFLRYFMAERLKPFFERHKIHFRNSLVGKREKWLKTKMSRKFAHVPRMVNCCSFDASLLSFGLWVSASTVRLLQIRYILECEIMWYL